MKAERLRVEHMPESVATQTPIVVRDIRKVYPAQDGSKPKVRGGREGGRYTGDA